MTDPGDEALLRGLAAGDERAFAALYDRFGERLYHVARGMLRRREDAEDAVQDVFLALARTRRRLGEVRDLTAYLFAALRRAAGRVATRRSRNPVAADVTGEAIVEADNGKSDDPRSERLEKALRALPREQREVIALKIDGELTFAQIGQVMGVSINTAASRYRYALEKLRASLQAAAPDATSKEH
jgi:RNA polymerase sigma-70 factor (ECF subfamily)